MRQAVEILSPWPQAYAFEQGDRLCLRRSSPHGQGLQQMPPRGAARIKGGGRILEDWLHFGARSPKLGRGEVLQPASGNQHLTGVRCQQAERDPAKRRLARTALAHQGHGFAGTDVEIDRSESNNAFATRAAEAFRHTCKLQQGYGHDPSPLLAV